MSILKAIGICNKVHKLLKWYKTFMVLNLIFWILVNCHSEDCMMTLWCVKWTSCLPRWSFTFTSLRSFLCFSCTQKHSTDEHNIVYSYFSITNKSKNIFLYEMSFCLQSERYIMRSEKLTFSWNRVQVFWIEPQVLWTLSYHLLTTTSPYSSLYI